jgi:hypothetical protein
LEKQRAGHISRPCDAFMHDTACMSAELLLQWLGNAVRALDCGYKQRSSNSAELRSKCRRNVRSRRNSENTICTTLVSLFSAFAPLHPAAVHHRVRDYCSLLPSDLSQGV